MKFLKMHGCGNDFIIADYKENIDYSNLAIKICDRYVGVGADGLILVKTNPLEMIYYNSDGSRAPMCGNGIRCFALYCYYNKIVNDLNFDVLTLAGIMKIEIKDLNPFNVRVNMGKAIYDNSLIKAYDDLSFKGRIIKVNDLEVKIYSLFAGTIHTVIFVDDFNDKVLDYAKDISDFYLFREKTNVNFVKVVNKDTIYVKTFERGCGWTFACGTGCCASVYVANELGKINNEANVILKYGTLNIKIEDNIYMTGPAKIVYEGEYKLC